MAVDFLIYDRDSIFSRRLHNEVTTLGVRVLRTPVRAPKANSVCERLGGTLRRECLDFLIPFNERHLKLLLKTWITHFNHERPHMSLGPGIPAASRAPVLERSDRHRIPPATRFDALLFSADSTMSIGSRNTLRKRRMNFSAEHRDRVTAVLRAAKARRKHALHFEDPVQRVIRSVIQAASALRSCGCLPS
jgi:hypothetical protein